MWLQATNEHNTEKHRYKLFLLSDDDQEEGYEVVSKAFAIGSKRSPTPPADIITADG